MRKKLMKCGRTESNDKTNKANMSPRWLMSRSRSGRKSRGQTGPGDQT